MQSTKVADPETPLSVQAYRHASTDCIHETAPASNETKVLNALGESPYYTVCHPLHACKAKPVYLELYIRYNSNSLAAPKCALCKQRADRGRVYLQCNQRQKQAGPQSCTSEPGIKTA